MAGRYVAGVHHPLALLLRVVVGHQQSSDMWMLLQSSSSCTKHGTACCIHQFQQAGLPVGSACTRLMNSSSRSMSSNRNSCSQRFCSWSDLLLVLHQLLLVLHQLLLVLLSSHGASSRFIGL
jgi:hypothetical protein